MKQVNPFIAFGAGAVPSDSFIGRTEDASNATTYTFTSHDIGEAHASRVVAVGIIVGDTGTDNEISSVTIGGSAATVATDTTSGGVVGNMRVAAIYYRAVAAGTTATIVVNMANGADSCGVSVWALYPASSTPVDAANTEHGGTFSTATAVDVAITTGGTLIAVVGHNNNNATTWNYTGVDTVTEEFDETFGDISARWSAATVSVNETATNRDIQGSWTGSVNACIAAASWT